MAGFGFKCALIAATACLAAGAAQPAGACSLVEYADNGRFVGGDLVTQIFTKADLIQLVRVTEKRLVTRTYSLGSWYLRFGDAELPADWPEYVDHFVFTLEAVDTLKGALASEPRLLENPLRVAGYDLSMYWPGDYPVSPGGVVHPNQLPEWLFDRPVNDGYAFIGASEDAGLGGGGCVSPYFLEVGQLFIALRRSDGRLYPPDGGFPLEIDVELAPQRGAREPASLNMQSLIPVTSADDQLIVRLRQRIEAER